MGRVLLGMRKPVHLLQHGSEVRDIVNMTALAVVDALRCGEEPLPSAATAAGGRVAAAMA